MTLRTLRNQYVAGLTSSISVMAGATCVAWVAPIIKRIQAGETPVKMTPSEMSWMVSLIEVGPFFTPTIAGILTDKLGRKPCINFSVFLYFLSWLLILFVPNAPALYLARTFQGMGLGITFTIVPMYLGEIAEPKVRGALTTWFQTMFHIGLVYEYCIGPYFSYRTVACANLSLCIIFFAMFFFQPESPHFLVMRNKNNKAYKSLKLLRGKNKLAGLDEELKEMEKSNEAENSGDKSSWKDVVSTPASRKALFLVVVASVTKALSGFLAVLSYATEAFSVVQQDLFSPDVYTILIGIVMSVVAILSTPFVDSLGRRPLLLISMFGCSFCNVLVGTFFYVHQFTSYDVSSYGWFTFVGLGLFFVFFSFGLGPIVLTLQSELFPSNTKGIASSFCALSFTVGSFVCLKFYQNITDTFGIHMNYWIYAVFCMSGFVITYFNLPETKGKTFSEIQQQFIDENRVV